MRGKGEAAYLRVRDDTVFLEDGKKMASVNLAIVVAKFVVGHVWFLGKKALTRITSVSCSHMRKYLGWVEGIGRY